jgi:hypothetical protein
VLIINKSKTALNAHVTLTGLGAPVSAGTWTWDGRGGIVHDPPTRIHANEINARYPARSMTLYVISRG